MSSVLKQNRLSHEEYFALEQAEDQRYEYHAGEVFAMAGGSESHALISMNVGAALVNALRGKPCRVYGADMKLYIRDYDKFCYPDVQVLCEKGIRHGNYVENPVLVVEVLSDSTEPYDRGRKFESYRSIESLQYCVMVDQNRPHVEVYERIENNRWRLNVSQDILVFPLLNIALDVEGVYRQVEFFNQPLSMMINISDLMNNLANQRKVYHSEADFQHAFAWEIHRLLPKSSVRLEMPLKNANGKTLHLDILIQSPDRTIAIELKYKTRKLLTDIDGETFSLTSHSAQDTGRYDFIKDIIRLENITSNLKSCEGYAILLTNDSAYWKQRTMGTVDEAFSLTQDRILKNSMAWTEEASDGTRKYRENDLELIGEYKLNWQDFSVVNTKNYGQFRYLAVRVPDCV